MEENEHVKTAIRWHQRPNDDDVIIQQVNEKVISFDIPSKTFCYDHVFGTSNQCEVYNVLVKPLVEKAFEGYDCTFLASGQTGSGKTYTMGFENSTNSENSGMTARVLNSIFANQNEKRVEVLISFVEVYCNQVFDLLRQKREPYHRKDHKLSDSIRKSVKNEVEVLALLSQGTKNRQVRGTNMNINSSRSHAVFTIYLRIVQTGTQIRESVINLVDLAGSECAGKTGNTGKAHVEGRSINGSLSAFTRVITELSNRNSHIPYRDSVITSMLRDYLKPDCYLTLLGCVSPYRSDYGATLSTLSFVAKAKLIKCTPQLNAIIDEFQKSNKPMTSTPHSAKRVRQPTLQSTIHKNSSSSSRHSISVIGNVSATKRFGNKFNSNSSTRKLGLSDNVGSPFASNRRASVVSRLFPTAASGGTIESMDINLHPSVLDFECGRIDSSKQVAKSTPMDIDQNSEHLLAEKLHSVLKDNGYGIDMNSVQDILGKLMTELSDKNVIQYPILSTVYENECSEATLNVEERLNSCGNAADAIENNENLNEEPMKDQIASVSSTNQLDLDLDLDSVLDFESVLDFDTNVSIKFDRIAKKVLIELNQPNEANKSYDDFIVLDHSDKDNIEEVNDKSSEVEDKTMYDETSLYTIQPSSTPPAHANIKNCDAVNGEIDENFDVTPQYGSLSQADSSVEDVLLNNSMKHFVTDRKVRTPIGKLVIRKVTHSNQFENTQYAVEVVHNFQRPTVENISPPTYNNHQDVTMDTPSHHPFLRSKTDASNTKSPRIILHRISTLQEYNEKHFGTSGEIPGSNAAADKPNRRKRTRTQDTCDTPTTSPKAIPDFNSRVLKILNTGSEKSLQKLHTIGAKKASQIFNYRTAKGQFRSLDGLLEMPFWSKKTHERFIRNNIFV